MKKQLENSMEKNLNKSSSFFCCKTKNYILQLYNVRGILNVRKGNTEK